MLLLQYCKVLLKRNSDRNVDGNFLQVTISQLHLHHRKAERRQGEGLSQARRLPHLRRDEARRASSVDGAERGRREHRGDVAWRSTGRPATTSASIAASELYLHGDGRVGVGDEAHDQLVAAGGARGRDGEGGVPLTAAMLLRSGGRLPRGKQPLRLPRGTQHGVHVAGGLEEGRVGQKGGEALSE